MPHQAKSAKSSRPKYRQIQGLEWALIRAKGPFKEPKNVRGLKGKGLAYERRFIRELPKLAERANVQGALYNGPWIEYCDSNGPGWARPDAFIKAPTGLILFECKLKQTAIAWDQMYGLYAPLLERIFGTEVACVQVCRYLEINDGTIVNYLGDVKNGTTWHWF